MPRTQLSYFIMNATTEAPALASPPEGATLYHKIQKVAVMTGLTDRRIRSYDQANGGRIARDDGPIKVRMFSPGDIFDIAAYKRSIGEAPSLPRPVTASVYLPKGGVGKSTICTEMAVLWQLAGLRVLVVDLDPQASSTVIFGYEPEADESDYQEYNLRREDLITATFANILDFPGNHGHSTTPFSTAIRKPYGENGPHLLPADVTLAQIFYDLDRAPNRDRRIESWIVQGRSKPSEKLDLTSYDVILFDNAPATSVLSRAALVASDFCISPVRLDALSAKSLSFIANEFTGLIESNLPCPRMISVPTFHNPQTTRTNLIMRGLWQNYGDTLIGHEIRASEVFPKSLLKVQPRERMPVSLQYPTHPVVTEDLKPIAMAILERFKGVANNG